MLIVIKESFVSDRSNVSENGYRYQMTLDLSRLLKNNKKKFGGIRIE